MSGNWSATTSGLVENWSVTVGRSNSVVSNVSREELVENWSSSDVKRNWSLGDIQRN
jgi:hypothetical protein